MPGIFSRLKNWVAEILTYADLNAEIDNIIANFEPLKMDDYSLNLAQMRTQTDPGESGSESLATTLAGELARIRYAINEIKGSTYWYQSSAYSLSSLGTALGGGLPNSRVISGKIRSGSNQALALDPDGTAATVVLRAVTTNFRYVIDGVEYVVTTDNSLSSLVTAPSTNNTCLVNDAGAVDQTQTKYWGEYGSSIIVDNMGSNISALVGKTAAFMVDNGVLQEYFIARVKSSTELDLAKRGYFFDDADLPIPRIVFSDNDVITLMKLTWIFINTSGALIPTYNEPRFGGTQPSGPSSGDYWFDSANNTWKVFNATTWDVAGVTFVGVCIQDSSGTQAARTQEYFTAVSDVSDVDLYIFDNTEVRSKSKGNLVSVNGTSLRYTEDQIRWDMDTDRDSGVSETASTTYFLYLTEAGDSKISDVGPHDRRADRKGLYHPHHTWRCVGQVFNNSSSNIEVVFDYLLQNDNAYAVTVSVGSNALTASLHRAIINPLRFTGSSTQNAAPVLVDAPIVVSSGSTLGTRNATAEVLVVHAINVNNHVECAISYSSFASNVTLSTTAEGGAGAADLGYILYSTTARSSVYALPLALIDSTQTTAGTWAATPTARIITDRNDVKFNVIEYLANGSFIVPAGVNQINLFGCGGGGAGGGGGVGANAGGGGGGGGAPILDITLPSVPLDSCTVTIGAGGTAGGIATIGGDGVATTVIGTNLLCTFPGGGGGGLGGTNIETNIGSDSMAPGGRAGIPNGASSGTGGGGGGSLGKGGRGAGGTTAVTAYVTAMAGGGGGGGGETTAGTKQTGYGGAASFYTNAVSTSGTGSGCNAGGGGGSAFAAGGNGPTTANTAGTAAAANSGAGGGGGSSGGTGATGGAGGSGRLYIRWRVN